MSASGDTLLPGFGEILAEAEGFFERSDDQKFLTATKGNQQS